MGDFAADTELSGKDGRYRARLSRDWEIWGPNGGYVAAIALRAAGAASPYARPACFSGHFLSVADFDDVDLDVVVLRVAKRAASLRVSMVQRGRAIFEALAWVVPELDGLEHDDTRMPDVAPPDQLRSMEELMPAERRAQRFRFWENLECRPLQFVPWEERISGPPVWREWYRFRPRATFDDPFVDAARSLLLIDTMGWPAACMRHVQNTTHVAPSMDVYAQFHDVAPGDEWLFCDTVAPIARGGLIGCQARVWSRGGRLLASGGGQLLCRPVTPKDAR
jgi:acyl-CoA thioesterase-2